MPYILSKLATGVDYTLYKKGPNGRNAAQETIKVKGGADVADKKTLVTPEGVPTQITEAQAKALKQHPVYNRQEKAGHVKILQNLPKNEAKAAADMAKDESAQLTRKDLEKSAAGAPKTGGTE